MNKAENPEARREDESFILTEEKKKKETKPR